jgi:endonuclease/exonuclease/phosphatase family metal-dependent hydrolase
MPMKMRVVTGALALLLCISASAAQAQSAFKVMTFNLWLSGSAAHRGNSKNNTLGPPAALALDAEFIAAQIGNSAGLVALQEVDKNTSRVPLNTPQVLDDGMGSGWVNRFGRARSTGGGDYGNATLSKVPIVAEQYWPFAFDKAKGSRCKEDRAAGQADPESCDYGTEARQATAIKLDFGSERQLWFVATHLDYHARVPTDQQLFELLGKVKGFDPDYPVIVAGDFNIPADGREHNAALQIMALAGFRLVGTDDVDYIFLYDPHDRLTVTRDRVVDAKRGDVTLSDHRAVIVDFAWN